MRRYWSWLLVLPLLLAAIGWQQRRPIELDVGNPQDSRFLQGFYDREGSGELSGRWTQPEASMRLPTPGWPALLTLRGAVMPAAGHVNVVQAAASATLSLPLGSTETSAPTPRSYHLLMIPAHAWDDTVAPRLIASRLTAGKAEARALGLLVRHARLDTPAHAAPWPPLSPLAAVMLLTIAVWALFRLGNAPAAPAALGALVIGAALAWGWGWQRLWVASFLWPLVLSLAWGIGVVLAARLKQDPFVSPRCFLFLLLGMATGFLAWSFAKYNWLGFWSRHGLPFLMLPLSVVLMYGSTRWMKLTAGCVAFVALAYMLMSYGSFWRSDWASDFAPLYRGPRAFWRGEALYQLDAIRANPLSNIYKYPPFFVLVMRPFLLLSPGPAFLAWKTVQIGLLVATAWLIWSAETGAWRRWSTLWLVVMLAFFQPIYDSVRYGQVDVLLLLILAAGLWAIRRDHWAFLGALLSLGTLIKLYPAYLILLPLLRRRWRGVGGYLAGLAGLGLVSLFLLGPSVHLTYLRDVLPISGGGTGWIENQTINGFLNRLVDARSIRLAPTGGAAVQLGTYAAAALVTLVALWWSQELPDDVAYGVLIAAMLLILPAAWIHYETLLVIPLYVCFVHAERTGGLPWSRAVPFALAWGLLCFGNQWAFFGKELYGPFWQLILSYKLYGVALLFATAGYRARAPRLRPAPIGSATLVPE